ncbi:MAG: DEAD/DEAH box helicase family protein [Nitrospira sp.]|nr:hypothetical protein [Candidatus Manganitrophaceae bacterium]HIL35353.1 hypothetical protein [Candidatus Manganitrophaceae bacterium]
MTIPEDQPREKIDAGLRESGWVIQDPDHADLSASRGVIIRDFLLDRGYGRVDYLLFLAGKAVGVLEAKKPGFTLTGVEVQSEKYRRGLPLSLPRFTRPLPFLYQSTGEEIRFTNCFDPEPRSRSLFAFHRPETLLEWIQEGMIEPTTRDMVAEASPEYGGRGRTFHERMQINMPPLALEGLWPEQIQAIKNLEQSLREGRSRTLIQMAAGSGKTHTAINFVYRLIKFADARRVLFLVDNGDQRDQTLKGFQHYVSPYNNSKFTEEYIVRRLSSRTLDLEERVCISTVRSMIAILKGRDPAKDDDESSEPISYNPSIPIETFDIIVIDECHASIYKRRAQVLEYFDATLIGLTASPDKETLNFFHRNLVTEDGQEKDLSDGLNIISDEH